MAIISTRGTRISCTVMLSNSMALWMISVSCALSTPSSCTVSMKVRSSASVTLGAPSCFFLRKGLRICTKSQTNGESTTRMHCSGAHMAILTFSGSSLA